MTPLLLIIAAVATLGAVGWLYARVRARRERFIDEFEFPQGVIERVRQRYPHLSETEVHSVIDALREYFHLCRKAGRRLLSMPSQVVDVAWHEFILFTRNYSAFCSRGPGRFIHHTPAEAMPSATVATDGLRRTWRLACLRAGIDPRAATSLPLLFAIDARLRIADGFHYALDCAALPTGAAPVRYCASHIGCGSGCGSGCSGSGCGSDGGGCGGGGD